MRAALSVHVTQTTTRPLPFTIRPHVCDGSSWPKQPIQYQSATTTVSGSLKEKRVRLVRALTQRSKSRTSTNECVLVSHGPRRRRAGVKGCTTPLCSHARSSYRRYECGEGRVRYESGITRSSTPKRCRLHAYDISGHTGTHPLALIRGLNAKRCLLVALHARRRLRLELGSRRVSHRTG